MSDLIKLTLAVTLFFVSATPDCFAKTSDILSGRDYYDSYIEYQTRLLAQFDAIAEEFDLVRIDANGTVYEVFQNLRSHVKELIKGMKPQKVQPKIEVSSQDSTSKITPKPQVPKISTGVHEGYQMAKVEDIVEFMKRLKTNLSKLTGMEISIQLKNLFDSIVKIVGYSRVLDTIMKSSTELSMISGLLNERDKNMLLKKIDFWKKKLNL